MSSTSKATGKELTFWRVKLIEYQKAYDKLRKGSPDNWWHNEDFDNQMRVWEALIVSTLLLLRIKINLTQPPRKLFAKF